MFIDNEIKKNINNKIFEINKYIQTSENNSKEKIYNKPSFKWCLNEQIKDISIEIGKLINNEIKKYKKIRFIDLFSGSTLFSLNIIKELSSIEIEKIIFNDIAYQNNNYINNFYNNDIIEYYSYDIKNIDYKTLFSENQNILNIVLINPLIGDNGFNDLKINIKDNKENINIKKQNFIINKIYEILPNNSLLLFLSTKEYDTNNLFINEDMKYYIFNKDLSLNNNEKEQLKLKQIFDKNFTIEDIKNENKYNAYISFKYNTEKSQLFLYYNGEKLLSKDEIKEKIENKKRNLFLNKSLKDINEKYLLLKEQI